MSPGVLQVGLRLRFCTGAQDTVLRVCLGMKAEPGDELTVSQVPPLFVLVRVSGLRAEIDLRRRAHVSRPGSASMWSWQLPLGSIGEWTRWLSPPGGRG